jgi:hypothetical protein
MPDMSTLSDDKLHPLLDDFHSREVLHVTFGSVLNHAPFRQRFFDTLCCHEQVYHQMLEKHFRRHLAPFGRGAVEQARESGQHFSQGF